MLARVMPMVLRFSHNRKNLLCIFQNDDDWGLYVRHDIIKYEQGRFIKGDYQLYYNAFDGFILLTINMKEFR